MTVQLRQIAHARSGDKGDISNVGLIALEARFYPILLRHVTAECVKKHFGPLCAGPVKRYELPSLWALNFVLEQALDGGGTISLRTDAQGKTHGAMLLLMQIEVNSDELADQLSGPSPTTHVEPAR